MTIRFNLILYHENCPDGFTSAWVFWSKFGKNAVYIPQSYNGGPPPDVTDKIVAIVDFSYSRDTLLEMAKVAEYIIVLDHHISAQRDLENLDLGLKGKIIFDMERAGAQLAWDYLYPGIIRPWFIDYVADRDLWRHELPLSKEISQALFFDGYLKSFYKLDTLYNSKNSLLVIDNFAKRGAQLLEYKNVEIDGYVRSAVPVTMKVDDKIYSVRLVNCPRHYRSEVGNTCCQVYDCDFAVMYSYDFTNRQWWLSMRAGPKSNVDLSMLSRRLSGGGGHRRAAGFVIYRDKGEDLHTYFEPIKV